ncbi:T9SS type A sorting domain-containing protein [Amniculibacterium aquaticum]|uniref:T9SS type A sorting domain-containing protein n=1 Tax=Amniculibacterium aquaticum TaxID=2479858 RepID=UPI000F5AC329|nr:T9SS type A sorting domain-containing protein [Amniculibacterium aquaticum]
MTGISAGSKLIIRNANASNTQLRLTGIEVTYTLPVTCTSPATQSTTFSSTNISTSSAQINWVRGNGDNVLVVAREGSAVNAAPVSGTSYVGDPALGLGDQIGTGNFVVYNGPANTVTLTDLLSNKNYHLAIYEYNNTGNCYNTTNPLVGNFTTLAAPAAFYRTTATGNWNQASTWESSVDGVTWTAASSTPKNTDNTITIRNGHTVTINSSITADQIVIENGGTLSTTAGLTLNDGAGDDVEIQNGGILILKGLPTYQTSASVIVKTGGVISLQAGSLVGATSVLHTKTIYENASVLDWNSTGTPAASGVTYFPNVDDSTVPIFRFSTNALSMGGLNPTTINGIVEIVNGVTASWASTGVKTIRNGITGAGTMTQNTAGKIVFSGANSSIGGTATLNLNENNGLEVSGNLVINGTLASGKVTNDGTITVKDGANFKHSSYSGSGTFTLEKATTADANKYVFWSSPVAAQNMYSIYTSPSPFVMAYNTATDYYDTLANPTAAAFGTGYSVKVPVAQGLATFTGTPNNGTQSVTINNTTNSNGNAYNLIGNPYPTNLDLAAFYLENLSNVGETFYFWNSSTGNNTTQTGAATGNPGWAVYNANTTTWSAAASGSNEIIRPGQAFIVKGLTTSVVFNNDMRTTTNTGVSFLNRAANTTNNGKYWLQMTNPANTYTTIAVTYGQGASNAFDAYDSKMMSIPNDAIYTTVSDKKLAIQGRADFVNTDMVVLGNKFAAAGNYTISLAKVSGLFENGQAIYLRDKQLNTYTDLTSQAYTFVSTTGEFTNRFEIVYQPQGSLATAEVKKDELKVYRNAEVFVVENSTNIDAVVVLDAAGRVVKSLKPLAKKAQFELNTKGVYLVKVISGGKEQTKKIIK